LSSIETVETFTGPSRARSVSPRSRDFKSLARAMIGALVARVCGDDAAGRDLELVTRDGPRRDRHMINQ